MNLFDRPIVLHVLLLASLACADAATSTTTGGTRTTTGGTSTSTGGTSTAGGTSTSQSPKTTLAATPVARVPITKQRCEVPFLVDPFDKSIAPYIRKRDPIKCYNNFYYAELELKTGIIRPNYSIIKEKSCTCTWNALKSLLRSADKNEYIYNDFKPFDSPIDMVDLRKKKNTDLVLIRCRCGFFKIEKSEKLFSYPNFKLDNRKEKATIRLDETAEKATTEKGIKKCPVAPNVIVIVIESLSYLNFKRHMKKTQDLFAQHFNSTLVEFESVIKVGDNSYPNMITLITGQPPKHYKWPYGITNTYFYDNQPLIWKEYEKKRGYYTGYVEDMPYYGIFNWVGKGFQTKNTDFYNRNFYCALNAFNSVTGGMGGGCRASSNQCYSGRYLLDVQFEQVESMMLRMEKEKQNYFIYHDPGFLTHDDFNMASTMDHHTARFINRNSELLKDSVFLFLGDHGNRYGVQMRSWVGRMESSWPYLAINVPKSVQKKYPQLMATVKRNSKRLVTWVDVHATLKDLADCNLDLRATKQFRVGREADPNQAVVNTTQIPAPELLEKRTNYSLFTEYVPFDRSCEDALIPSAFCICLPRSKIAADSFEAHRAGEEFIKQLNKRLENFKKDCHELKLSKITDISKVSKDAGYQTYDMVVEASPSKGIFRGELNKHPTGEWSLSDNFERFNKYGKQGNCISDKNLQKVCYCKKQQ